MDIKTKVQTLLRIKGMTQKELAEKLGITPVGLSQTLASKYPSTRTLERIATALDVSIDELFSIPQTRPAIQAKEQFTALVANGSTLYRCSSINELQELIYMLKKEESRE